RLRRSMDAPPLRISAAGSVPEPTAALAFLRSSASSRSRRWRMSRREPAAMRPRRMEPLATLPLFFDLKGRRAVIVGGSEAAAWKAELLSAAGANVEVLAPT